MANSSFMRRASTTVTMLSKRAMPSLMYFGPIVGIEQIVCAMGAGSQTPLASMTI